MDNQLAITVRIAGTMPLTEAERAAEQATMHLREGGPLWCLAMGELVTVRGKLWRRDLLLASAREPGLEVVFELERRFPGEAGGEPGGDQVQYAGDPKEFAWVLPVGPGAPQAETQKGVPTRVVARYETLGGLDSGVMYYVAAMVGKTQNTPPTDLLPGLLAAAEKQGFQPLGVEVGDGKPLKDGQGNPGRRLKLTHLKSHRTGVGKVLVNRLTGAFLLVAGFGPDAEAFVKSAQLL